MSPDALAQVLGSVCERLGFLTPLGTAPLPEAGGIALVVTVTADDPAHHRVALALGPGTAEELARNLAALAPGAPVPPEDAADAARELANVLAGNLMPLLCGDAAEVRLGVPTIAANCAPPTGAVAIELVEGLVAAWVEPRGTVPDPRPRVAGDMP